MKIYNFLASYRFALLLIFLSAFGAAVGTFLESKTDSHRLAEDLIYHHPLFQILLGGFFLNILLSALSRYPFKKRHFPFLITHLGLLMLILGVIIKNHFGTQGNLHLVEGTATDYFTDPKVPAISIEKRFPSEISSIPLFKLSPLEYYPHAEEKFISWIFDNHIHILGLNPIEQSAFNLSTLFDDIPMRIENRNGKTLIQTKNNETVFDPYKLEEWIAYDRGFKGYTVQAKIFNDLTESTYNALYWIATLFEEGNLFEHLKAKGWPFIDQLENLSKEEQYITLMKQFFAVKDQLPPPKNLTSATLSRMHALYLKLVDKMTLESPLKHIIEPKAPPLKLEDATPGIVIDFRGEEISLIYDTTYTRLKWPSKDGNHLFKFQPHRIKLPFSVRLHQAREIKYPGSNQAASFECALSIDSTPCTLRMNEVHETPEGYRLYLAHMEKIDPYGVRSVQLIVNHDPAKRILTYPGGILVSLGILLLFFKR